MTPRLESSWRGTLWALLAAILASVLLWPEAWLLGHSVYGTDAIFAQLPWREAFAGIAPHNREIGDQDFVFFGQLAAAVRTLHEHGVLPTWNPSTYAGVPLAGNVQIPVLDPLHLVLVLFQPSGEPFSAWRLALGLTWTGIFRFVVCCHFAFLWLRCVCGRPWLAFFAALALAAGPYAALWWFSTPGQVLAFFPLALYCLERRLRGGSARWLAGSTLGLALSHYGGYPQTTLFLALFLLGYVLWHGEIRARRRRLLEAAAVIATSVLLALPLYLPFLLYLRESAVGALRSATNARALEQLGHVQLWTGLAALAAVVLAWRLPQRRGTSPRVRVLAAGGLAGLAVVALRLGGAAGEGLYGLFPSVAGHPLSPLGYVGPRPYIETNQDHVGLLSLLLLVAALRGRASRVAFFGLVAVLLVASGAPIAAAPLRFLVPMLEPSRAATLVPPLLALGLALAGRRLLAFPGPERPRELQLAALAVTGFLVVVSVDHLVQSSLTFAERGLLPSVPASSWFGVLRDDTGDFWAYSGLVALYVRLPRMGPGTLFALATLFVCLRGAPRTLLFAKGLFAAAVGLLVWPGLWFQPHVPPERVFPRTESLDWLRAQKAQDPELRLFAPNPEILPGTTATVYGLDRVLGVDGFDPQPYVQLVCHLPRDPRLADKRAAWNAATLRLDGPLMDLFAARLVVAKQGQPRPPHFAARLEADGLVIWENPFALPRFLLVPESFDLDPDPFELLRRDLRRSVGLHGEHVLPGPPASSTGLEILERGPNGSYTVETRADGAAYLVLLDQWLPGWQVTVDGAAAELLRANVAFRAVAVPAGTHRVRFWYEPPGLRLGGYGFLAGLLLGLLVLLFPRRFESRAARRPR